MRRYLLAATASLALCARAETAYGQTRVDVEMAIVFDTSTSVAVFSDIPRLVAQHAQLFNNPRLMPFLRQQGISSIAVAAFSFGSPVNQFQGEVRQFTPWQRIESTTQAQAFAASLNNAIATPTNVIVGGRSPLNAGLWYPTFGGAPGVTPPFSNVDFTAAAVPVGITPVGLLGNTFAGSRLTLNFVSDAQLAVIIPAGLPLTVVVNDAAAEGVNINVLGVGAVNTSTADTISTGTTLSGAAAFVLSVDLSGPDAGLFEGICQKFGRELVATTPAVNADCATLLASGTPLIVEVVVPRTVTNVTVRSTRQPRVTDVALPASALVGPTTMTVTETVTRTAQPDVLQDDGTYRRVIDELTTQQIEIVSIEYAPLRMPLEYGALTRLGAALFGEMLENQPQRAQRLRGQVAPRGPASVRGDGAPSTADQAQGGIFAAAGLNDSLRYTASGQFAALPGFDFGWGEGQAGLDPAFTGSTGIWGRPFYSRARMNGGRGVDSYDHTHRGFAMGADVRIGRYGLVGVWGGGSQADVGFGGPGGGGPSSGSMSSWVGGVYGSAATGSLESGLWYADVTLGYGEQDWTLNRTTLAGAPAHGEFRSPALGPTPRRALPGSGGRCCGSRICSCARCRRSARPWPRPARMRAWRGRWMGRASAR